MCVLGAEGGQRGIRSSATGAIGSCEPPCGCWTLSLGPLQEQEELLTVQPIRSLGAQDLGSRLIPNLTQHFFLPDFL